MGSNLEVDTCNDPLIRSVLYKTTYSTYVAPSFSSVNYRMEWLVYMPKMRKGETIS